MRRSVGGAYNIGATYAMSKLISPILASVRKMDGESEFSESARGGKTSVGEGGLQAVRESRVR